MAPKRKRFKKDCNHEISTEFPIGKLPDEVLLQVFEFVDGNSLKNAALVCKKWDKIIGSSVTTMKKFRLRIEISVKEIAYDIMNLRRKHVTMRALLDEPETSVIFEKIFKRFGAHLQELDIPENGLVLSTKSLKNVLKNLPLLKTLKMHQIGIGLGRLEVEKENFPVRMDHLTTLKLYYDRSILRFISAPQLKTLEVFARFGKFQDLGEHEVTFTNFLKSVPNLQSLRCNTGLISKSFKTATEGFPFKLKKFYEIYHFTTTKEEVQDFWKFFLSQASTLEDICYTSTSPYDLNFLLSKLKNIRIWRDMNLAKLLKDQEFYDQLKPMKLKEIHSNEVFPNKIAAQGILRNCPDLEILNLVEYGSQIHHMLPFVAQNNPKIKFLSIYQLLSPCEVHFPCLKTLNIYTEGVNTSSISSFLKTNQTIETLKIDKIQHHEYKPFNQFNVKHLTLRGYKKYLKEIYDYIKADPKSIKTLELVFVDSKTEHQYCDLNFVFPENRTKWKEHHETFDRTGEIIHLLFEHF